MLMRACMLLHGMVGNTCMYLCMYACTCVRVCTRTHAHTCTNVRARTHIHAHAHMYMHGKVKMCTFSECDVYTTAERFCFHTE